MANGSAKFAIEIAATMTGDETQGELDELTKSLLSGGKGAEELQLAIQGVSRELQTAKAAAAAANMALAEGNAKYNELERAAVQAAKSVAKASKVGAEAPADLVAASNAAKSALEAHAIALGGVESKAKAASAEEARLIATLGNMRKIGGHVDRSFGASNERLEAFRGVLSSTGGAAGRFGSDVLGTVQATGKLGASMGTTNAIMVAAGVAAAAVAAAIVAVGVAAVVATAKIASWAVGLADAARNSALAREAFYAMNPSLAGLSASISEVSAATGVAEADLRSMAKQLQKAKVSATDLPDALRAAALAETALGKGGSAEFIDQIQGGKKAVSALSAEVQAKLGGVVAKQMQGLDAQSERLKKNLASTFGGLNIDPALSGMSTLVGLFDKNSASGEAMGFLFEKVFQPLIDQSERAALVVRGFVLGFLIGLLKLYIAAKPAIAAISELFGFEDTSLNDVLATAKSIGEKVAPVFAVIAAAWVAAAVAAGALVAAVVGLSVAWGSALISIYSSVVGWFGKAIDFIRGIDLGQIGKDLMAGLVEGISGAADAVVNAITGVVDGAIDAAKKALGIASPSKVFADIGVNVGEGFAGGVDETTPAAQGALESMVSPHDSRAAATSGGDSGGGAGSSSSTTSVVFDFSGMTVHGVGSAEDISLALESRFSELYLRELEGMLLSIGGGSSA